MARCHLCGVTIDRRRRKSFARQLRLDGGEDLVCADCTHERQPRILPGAIRLNGQKIADVVRVELETGLGVMRWPWGVAG